MPQSECHQEAAGLEPGPVPPAVKSQHGCWQLELVAGRRRPQKTDLGLKCPLAGRWAGKLRQVVLLRTVRADPGAARVPPHLSSLIPAQTFRGRHGVGPVRCDLQCARPWTKA